MISFLIHIFYYFNELKTFQFSKQHSDEDNKHVDFEVIVRFILIIIRISHFRDLLDDTRFLGTDNIFHKQPNSFVKRDPPL